VALETQPSVRTEVRPARPNDVAKLSEFFVEAWREAGPGAMGFTGATDAAIKEVSSPEFLKRRLASPNAQIVVAEEERKVVGFASVRLMEGLEAELTGIVVLGRASGRGVGTRLLRKAAEGARRRGCARMSVTTEAANAKAIGFYKKAGFTESRKSMEKRGSTRVAVQVLVRKLR
jgi:ribosomal protein S18 acetylase RimI-like enzyme